MTAYFSTSVVLDFYDETFTTYKSQLWKQQC